MASQAQTAGNQANAQKSTGAVTPEGKAAASKNALKTGLTGHTVLLPSDDAELYASISKASVPLQLGERPNADPTDQRSQSAPVKAARTYAQAIDAGKADNFDSGEFGFEFSTEEIWAEVLRLYPNGYVRS